MATWRRRPPNAGTTSAIYKDERWGRSGYDVPVSSSGTYRLRLHLTETAFNAAGQRIFGIAAEGQPIATNMDIFARAGGRTKAYVLDVPVTVQDGVLNLRFTKRIDNPTLSGIEVLAG